MTYDVPIIIESLGKRIEWLMRNLEHDHQCLGDANDTLLAPGTLKAVYQTVCKLKPAMNLTLQSWGRYGRGESRTPVAVIDALHALYPAMDVDALTTPRFKDFLAATEKITQAYQRWEKATRHVATNRADLATLAKAYYRPVDDSRDYRPVPDGPVFPLITLPGWLLEAPVPLSETDSAPPFEWLVDDKNGFALEGWPGPYWLIKKQSLPPSSRNKLFDNPTYRISKVMADGKQLELSYSPGSYFNYIDTCEVLGVELADFVIRHPDQAPVPQNLGLRGPPERAFEFQTRSAFPGVNCLLILRNFYKIKSGSAKGKSLHRFLMHYRSSATLEAPNVRHVVPAGGHQPITESFETVADASLWRTVARELVEEVFNKEEAARIHQSGVGFLDHPDVRPVVDAVFRETGVAKAHLLGIGLDPVTTKPEVLVALVVDWQKFQQKVANFPIKQNYEGKIEYCDLTRDRLLVEAQGGAEGKPVQPAGAACLLLAHKFFESLTV